jgi:fatty-acyl-CoA synthase
MASSPSYVHGASEQPLIGATIGRYFDAVCARGAGRDALVVRHQEVRLTYAELRERVDALACGLLRLGLAPGDRVGIWSQNNLEWVLTQFATAKAGLILVNINPAYRRRELEYALRKVGCRALILSPRFKSSEYLEIITSVVEELPASEPGKLRAAALPELQWVIRLGEERTPGMLNLGDVTTAATRRSWRRSRRSASNCNSTLQPTSNSPRERPASPRAPRFPITTSSTTAISSERR